MGGGGAASGGGGIKGVKETVRRVLGDKSWCASSAGLSSCSTYKA